MEWRSLGKIFEVNNNSDWMFSHSSVPTALHLKNSIFRIFFSTRNKLNKSYGAFIDFDFDTLKVLSISSLPVFKPGDLGLFDDCGTTLSCYIEDLSLFYYMGWHLSKTVPFSNQIGIFHLDKFENVGKRLFRHPKLGKCEYEPLSFGYPWILKRDKQFIMWYDTILKWEENSTKNYKFILRSATSEDGINWKKNYNDSFILFENERAIARPCILFEDQIYKMWYSIDVAGYYNLGYATSNDGLNWERKDSCFKFIRSSCGFDFEQIEYPFVLNYKGRKFMLYNGNGFGKSGIGLAKLEN